MNVFFIVEDSETVLGYLQSILYDMPGMTLVGHATEGRDALERIDALLPDVVILDVGLKNAAAIGILENIRRRHPAIKVMVLGDCTNELCFNHCKRIGANRFFDKNSQPLHIRAALWDWVNAYSLGSESCR